MENFKDEISKDSILDTITERFQYNTVLEWNKYVADVVKVVIPRVFLYDEITTDRYRKCIIELLTKFGIIEKIQ